MNPQDLSTDLFDYPLPPERIAQHPLPERDQARLLVLNRITGALDHRQVGHLPDLLGPQDLLVVNNTKVIHARIRGRKPSGGRVELLLVRPLDHGHRWRALTRSNRPLKAGQTLLMGQRDHRVVVIEAGEEAVVAFDSDQAAWDLMAQAGELPLPPYIDRPVEASDLVRYQTIYAQEPGAVAAPTAGLHFTPSLIQRLERRGVAMASITLHVGPGTFRPVRAERICDHDLPAEWVRVPHETVRAIEGARERGGRVIGVGTTVARALEGTARGGRAVVHEGDVACLIVPGYGFQVLDGLFTNFHLPRSSLLALVSALAGREHLLAAYAVALSSGYRFASYGDAMLVR